MEQTMVQNQHARRFPLTAASVLIFTTTHRHLVLL